MKANTKHSTSPQIVKASFRTELLSVDRDLISTGNVTGWLACPVTNSTLLGACPFRGKERSKAHTVWLKERNNDAVANWLPGHARLPSPNVKTVGSGAAFGPSNRSGWNSSGA